MREDPSVIPECLQVLARLHARIHGQPARQFGSLKSRLATNIAGTGFLDERRRQILLGRYARRRPSLSRRFPPDQRLGPKLAADDD